MSKVKDEVISAQGRILDLLIACEDRISLTYAKFAVAFPAYAAFWGRLVREERQHGLALNKLHSFLARGLLFHNIGRFDQQAMKSLQATLDEAEQTVASGEMDVLESFAVALKLECSLMESHFYASVTSDAPEFQAVSKVLQAETEKHIALLHAEFAKIPTVNSTYFDHDSSHRREGTGAHKRPAS